MSFVYRGNFSENVNLQLQSLGYLEIVLFLFFTIFSNIYLEIIDILFPLISSLGFIQPPNNGHLFLKGWKMTITWLGRKDLFINFNKISFFWWYLDTTCAAVEKVDAAQKGQPVILTVYFFYFNFEQPVNIEADGPTNK